MTVPHLIDRWQNEPSTLKHGVAKAVKAATPIARRFVFDAEASTHVGRLLFSAGDLVAEQIVFAKPPYDYTYIELQDMRAMFQAWRPVHSSSYQKTTDTHLGLLYSKDRLYTFCANDTDADIQPMLGMFSIGIGHGQRLPLTSVFGNGPTHMEKEAWLIALNYVKLAHLLGGMRQPDGSIAMCNADPDYFLGNYDLCSTILYPTGSTINSLIDAAFLGGGDVLIGAACMLLIHGNKRGVTMEQVPHKRAFWRGKQVVYKAHNVVRIKLGPHESIRRVAFGARESPRRHEVMGTWVHYHRNRHCVHDWVRMEDQDHERYQCSKCTTLRTWRTAHVRGEGGKGVVTKEYAVTE